MEIAQERQECEKLEAMIVHSPERLKQEHAHMTEQLREEQETLQEVEEQHREMRTRLDRVAKLDKAMDKLSALLNETKAALAEKKQARKSVKALQDSMERHKDRIQELKGRKEVRTCAASHAGNVRSSLLAPPPRVLTRLWFLPSPAVGRDGCPARV